MEWHFDDGLLQLVAALRPGDVVCLAALGVLLLVVRLLARRR